MDARDTAEMTWLRERRRQLDRAIAALVRLQKATVPLRWPRRPRAAKHRHK